MRLKNEGNGFFSPDKRRLWENLTALFNLGKMDPESFHRSTTAEEEMDIICKKIIQTGHENEGS